MLRPITLGCRLPPPPPRLPGLWDPRRSRSRSPSRGGSRVLRVRGRARFIPGEGAEDWRAKTRGHRPPHRLREWTFGAPERRLRRRREPVKGGGPWRRRPQPSPALPRSIPSPGPIGPRETSAGAQKGGSEGAGGRAASPGSLHVPPGRDPHLSPDPPPARGHAGSASRPGSRPPAAGGLLRPSRGQWAAGKEVSRVRAGCRSGPCPRCCALRLPFPQAGRGAARPPRRRRRLVPPGHHGALPVVRRSRGGAVLARDVPGIGVRLAAPPGGAGRGCPGQWGHGRWHVGSDSSGVRVPATELGPRVR